MIGAAFAAWVALAPGRLQVASDSTCPSPADAARRLAELAPAAPEAPARAGVEDPQANQWQAVDCGKFVLCYGEYFMCDCTSAGCVHGGPTAISPIWTSS